MEEIRCFSLRNGMALWSESETKLGNCHVGQLGFMRGYMVAPVWHGSKTRKSGQRACLVRCIVEVRWLMPVRLICKLP